MITGQQIVKFADWSKPVALTCEKVTVKKIIFTAQRTTVSESPTFKSPVIQLRSKQQTTDLSGMFLIRGLDNTNTFYLFICDAQIEHHTTLNVNVIGNDFTIVDGSIWMDLNGKM